MTTLYLIVCGARPAEQTVRHATDLVTEGWDVCVIATPEGVRFFDPQAVEAVTGHPVRTTFKQPDAPDVLPAPDSVAVVPATFNTINKWAAGISDTLALGFLNESLGLGIPVVAVPWAKPALRGHPVYSRSLALLRTAGVTFVESSGESGGAFPWTEITDALRDHD